jgi:hypothetical protein
MEELKSTKWIGIYDDKPTNDDLVESCMTGKHIKTSPHECFRRKCINERKQTCRTGALSLAKL